MARVNWNQAKGGAWVAEAKHPMSDKIVWKGRIEHYVASENATRKAVLTVTFWHEGKMKEGAKPEVCLCGNVLEAKAKFESVIPKVG